MSVVLRLLWRIVVVFIGYGAAALAAGFFLLLARDIADIDTLLGDASETYRFETLVLTLGTGLVFAGIGFTPSAVGILLAEIFAIRSWIFYTLVGGLIAYLVVGILHWAPVDREMAADPSDWTLILASGAVAGLVYWLIAGRGAGLRTEKPGAIPSADAPD